MSPNYKISYFNVDGSGEPSRYILAYGASQWEDYRVPRNEWPDLKKKTPFGKLPVLEVDGKQIAQSNTIARYLGKQFNLVGKDDWEAVQCDMLVDTYGDLSQSLMSFMFESDPTKKEEKKKKALEEDGPFYLGKFEDILTKNGSGYLVGSQLTWADLFFAAKLSSMKERHPELLKPFPKLLALVDKVNNLPKIKAYLDKRPARDPPPQRKN
uniref:glutathione transferase n=1 Tax=Lissorhoptrus oryzophilus TaxID=308863 RepID=A0A2R4FXC9_9CUCU|nr:glutathione S-transferase s2 [Lissorhoptrus oryzophilus]